MDEPTGIPDHRLPARGEPGSARATRRTPPPVERRSTPSIGRESKGTGRTASGRNEPHCHVGDFVSLASETDRAEIRWQWPARTRTTAHGERDRSVGAANGRRKPRLGLSAYPRG